MKEQEMDTHSGKWNLPGRSEARRIAYRALAIVCALTLALGLTGASSAQTSSSNALEDPSPSFRAFPDRESVDGTNWPLGASVHLVIDDPDSAGVFHYEGNETVVGGDSGPTYVLFEFGGTYDLKVGDVVTLTGNPWSREQVIPDVSISNVDLEKDEVAGKAPRDTPLHVFSGPDANLSVTANSDGVWLAEFSSVKLDLVPGTNGGAEVWDLDGNSTIFDWSAPSSPPPPLPPPAPMTYIVNTTEDSNAGTCDGGPCSLREAINAANNHPGADTIAFEIPGPAPFTIQPRSGLPGIVDPVTIDGTTQLGPEGAPVIEVSGEIAGEASGLAITGGNATVTGLVINRFLGNGIDVGGDGGSVIEGNFIGTDTTGTPGLGNASFGIAVHSDGNSIVGNLISGNGGDGLGIFGYGSDANTVQGNLIGTDAYGLGSLPNEGQGVWIGDGASDTAIGGDDAEARNVISGNKSGGISINGPGTGNVVHGNYIGTDASGTTPLPNTSNGLTINSSASNTVEGNVISDNLYDGVNIGSSPDNTLKGNIISGNGGNGVSIAGEGSTGNMILGNRIGTSMDGSAAFGNSVGVWLGEGAIGTTIGGTSDAARNVISGNNGDGISINGPVAGTMVEGNYIGTDASGTLDLGNGGNGVLLGGGASENLVGGTDAGARNIISGNSANGVAIFNPGTAGNLVRGNYIGTDVTGTAALGNEAPGIGIGDQASGNVIGGVAPGEGNLISGNNGDGISISGPEAGTIVVQGNYIGTDRSGMEPLPNQSNGVNLANGTHHNLIGGTEPGAGNLISGNSGSGVAVGDAGTSWNSVLGNLIGTSATGMEALGNMGSGVVLAWGAADNVIGGIEPEAGNVISANEGAGIVLVKEGTNKNVVQGNYIGTNVDGTGALPNAPSGVWITDGASYNQIGGTDPASGNLISGNEEGVIILAEGGVAPIGNVLEGNYIGTDPTGLAALPNQYRGVAILDGASQNRIGGTAPGVGNSIAFNGAGITLSAEAGSGNSILANAVFANDWLGIDLGEDGVTSNDPRDRDVGPNGLQNFPVLSPPILFHGSLKVAGVLWSKPNSTYRIEFFEVTTCDPSGYGEGDRYQGFMTVRTGPLGFAAFVFQLPRDFDPRASVSATATDPVGSTSEFSHCSGPARIVGGGR